MLIDTLIEHLQEDGDEPSRQEALLRAASVFERWRLRRRDLVEAALRRGWSRDVVEAELEPEDVDRLAQAVREVIVEGRRSAVERDAALWALGKRRDSELLSFFREELTRALEERAGAALLHAMNALEALGESVFWGSAGSVVEAELNRVQAREYLARTAPSPETAG